MKPLTKIVSNKLITRSALVLVTTFSINAAHADPEPSAYAMSVFEDSFGGRDVLSGEYGRVIANLDISNANAADMFAAYTSLCVAYTKSGDFPNAEIACRTAVDVSRKAISGSRNRSRVGFSQRSLRRDLALALSNRGVLRVFTGVAELAKQDFVEASELKTALPTPHTNLSRLEETLDS